MQVCFAGSHLTKDVREACHNGKLWCCTGSHEVHFCVGGAEVEKGSSEVKVLTAAESTSIFNFTVVTF